MFKNPLIPWILVVFGITMAVLFSIRSDRATERAEKAEAVIREENRLEVIGANMQSATFVRTDGSSIYFRTPTYTTVNGEQFAGIEERAARIHEDIRVFGIPGSEGLDAISSIPEGADIRIQLGTPEGGALEAYTVVVIP